MNLTKEQILAADDMKIEIVEVPEWGGVVGVATFSGTARDEWESMTFNDDGKIDRSQRRAKLCAMTMVNPETKKLLFSQSEVEKLGRKSAVALDRVFDVSMRINKIGAEQAQDLEKNSDSIPGEDSAST